MFSVTVLRSPNEVSVCGILSLTAVSHAVLKDFTPPSYIPTVTGSFAAMTGLGRILGFVYQVGQEFFRPSLNPRTIMSFLIRGA